MFSHRFVRSPAVPASPDARGHRTKYLRSRILRGRHRVRVRTAPVPPSQPRARQQQAGTILSVRASVVTLARAAPRTGARPVPPRVAQISGEASAKTDFVR